MAARSKNRTSNMRQSHLLSKAREPPLDSQGPALSQFIIGSLIQGRRRAPRRYITVECRTNAHQTSATRANMAFAKLKPGRCLLIVRDRPPARGIEEMARRRGPSNVIQA